MHKPFAIFDMDGTLIDSMGLWYNLGREYLQSKGVAENLEGVLEEIRPLTMSEAAAWFVDRLTLAETPEAVADAMNGIMAAHYRQDVPLKPGVREHLERLRQEGVRMCAASATAEHLMEACLQRLGVRPYFDFLLSCESLGTSKREPHIYLEAARRLGAAPGETAVYEDALYAIQTAKKANFHVIAVYDADAAGHWDEIRRLADETISFA